MLKRTGLLDGDIDGLEHAPAKDQLFAANLPWGLVLERRREILMLVITASGAALALAAVYLVISPPGYYAVARVLMDSGLPEVGLGGTGGSEGRSDVIAANSQTEIIQSGAIASAVVRRMRLDADPEFAVRPGGMRWFGDALGGLATSAREPDTPFQKAVLQFARMLSVHRIQQTYVVEVGFRSSDATKAAAIANSVAEAYLEDPLNARAASEERRSMWERQKIDAMAAKYKELADELAVASSNMRPADTEGMPNASRIDGLRSAVQYYKENYEATRNVGRHARAIADRYVPTTAARVLTRADPSLATRTPSPLLVILVSSLAGAMLGLAAGLVRELLDSRVRSELQIEQGLSVRGLGAVPLANPAERAGRLWQRLSGRWRRAGRRSRRRSRAEEAAQPPLLPEEIFRSIRIAVDNHELTTSCPVIGTTAVASADGATTVSVNLARVMGLSRRRVLLIDGEWHHRTLSKAFAPGALKGLADVLAGSVPVENAVVRREDFDVLPQPLGGCAGHPADCFGTAQMEQMISTVRKQYDYVVIDLPAAIDHVEVCSIANVVNWFIVVSDWNRTTIEDLRSCLSMLMATPSRVFGVLINKKHVA